MNIASLISSFKADGTLDSEGRFTVGLKQARKKLTAFNSSDTSRYLVVLVGAGIGAGARGLALDKSPGGLRLTMPGAYYRESELMAAFEQLFVRTARPTTTDLLLGLHMALGEGALECAVTCQDEEQPSFRWVLGQEHEASEEAPSGSTATIIEITFSERASGPLRWLQGSPSSSEHSDGHQLLEKLCAHASVPVMVGNKKLNRPIRLPHAPIALVRGEQTDVKLESPTIISDQAGRWTGALALRPGVVSLVVHGVMFEGPSNLRLDGVIYADKLRLDISRERVVKDRAYKGLLRQLKRVRTEMLTWVDLDSVPRGWPSQMADLLIEPALAGRISQDKMKRLVEWLDSQPRSPDDSSRLAELRFLYQMAQLYERVDGGGQRLKRTAKKAYEQAHLQFANEGLDPSLVDMCAWLAEHLDSGQLAATNWRTLGAGLALGRRRADSERRLRRLLKKTMRPEREAHVRMGLAAYLDTVGQEDSAKRERSQVAELLEVIDQRVERRNIQDLLSEDAILACSLVAHTLRHFASHSPVVARAITRASRR